MRANRAHRQDIRRADPSLEGVTRQAINSPSSGGYMSCHRPHSRNRNHNHNHDYLIITVQITAVLQQQFIFILISFSIWLFPLCSALLRSAPTSSQLIYSVVYCTVSFSLCLAITSCESYEHFVRETANEAPTPRSNLIAQHTAPHDTTPHDTTPHHTTPPSLRGDHI